MFARALLLSLFFALTAVPARAQQQPATTQPAPRDTASDTWAGVDDLGRVLPDASQARPARADRFVAMFYFLWQDAAEKQGPFDVTQILAADPLAMGKPTSPPWGPMYAMHFWGQPLFGYYLCDDPWVLRRHAQMLSDAGVDVIIFDTSNKVTYRRNYTALMETYRQIRREGGRTPQVAFLTPFGDPRSTVHELYDDLYSKKLYEELWFRWDGKPLILADPNQVGPDERGFFSFRAPQPDYFKGPKRPDMWSWLEVSPQHVFMNSRGEKEQMSVGVAQNAVDGRLGSMSEANSHGRSFHDGRPGAGDSERLGLNFAEQWDRALKEDPKIVFITGWNEWVAGRFPEFNGVRRPVMFVDEFDQEHSRDIEPMLNGHGDDYYCQLIANVRRFKGVRPAPRASGRRTIALNTDFSQWSGVGPEYLDDLFDTAHRRHAGFANAGQYVDDTGRNDLDLMKVTSDADHFFFYVRTRSPLTPSDGANWMELFLSVDFNAGRSWHGFDFLVNRTRDKNRCSIEASVGGWKWKSVGQGTLACSGNELHLAIPRKLLGGAAAHDGAASFAFKWADNTAADGNIQDFYTHGDVAPNGRFAYRYSE